MELSDTQGGMLEEYLQPYHTLMGDLRTWVTFRETVKGIIAAGSLVCQRIAAHSQRLSCAHEGGQRVSRLARGESTKRSQVDAETLTRVLRERGLEHLAGTDSDALWLIADLSEVRKPYARAMPDLMQVCALDGSLVPGYRSVNVLGITPSRRGILYHRLFSSQEQDFLSESREIQVALQTVSQAVAALPQQMVITWIMDSGFDDIAVWRTIWEQGEHLVCRLKHLERLVAYREVQGQWIEGHLQEAIPLLELLATAQTEMVVQRKGQARPKRQEVRAEIRATPLRVTYETQVRREGTGKIAQQMVWLVEVRLRGTSLDPWYLLTDWPVMDAEQALTIFRMYRQRWAVEDSFRFLKDTLGWEEVQLLNLQGIRTLLALGWVAAGFLYELGISLEWEEVQLLARLGGWADRKNNKPGKIVLTRGLRRLLDLLVTQALLDRYRAENGHLPPRIAALLPPSPPDHL